MALFGRQVLVQLGSSNLADSFSDLRVTFNVEKTLKSEPNSATIEIYGLSRSSIASYLELDRDLRVRLFAGLGGVTPLLFDGFPTKKEGLRFDATGPERILRIKAKDGLKRYQRARVNLALGQATTFEDALAEVAGELGLPVGQIDTPGDIQLTQGATFVGQASEVMDRLARSANADWSIQDGKLQFIQRSGRRNGQGPLFSTELGNIIGMPRRKEKGTVEVTTLIQESVIPGALFRLKTDEGFFNGDYKIHKVKYTGDSHYGNEFYAVIEGKPYQTVADAAKLAPGPAGRLLNKVNEKLRDLGLEEVRVKEGVTIENDFG